MFSRMKCICCILIFLCACVPPGYRYQNNVSSNDYFVVAASNVRLPKGNNYKKTSYPNNDLLAKKYNYRNKKIKYIKNYKAKNEKDVCKKYKFYKIKKGETLYRISRKFKISLNLICRINHITNPSKIKAGQIIKVPVNFVGNKKYDNKGISYKKSNLVKFRWPVDNIISYKRDGNNSVKPIGLYIKSKPGIKVKASEKGKVVEVGYMRGFGNFVIIKHPENFYTVYSNLNRIFIKNGEILNKGDYIGTIPENNPLLHFQINKSGKPLNPLKYLTKL